MQTCHSYCLSSNRLIRKFAFFSIQKISVQLQTIQIELFIRLIDPIFIAFIALFSLFQPLFSAFGFSARMAEKDDSVSPVFRDCELLLHFAFVPSAMDKQFAFCLCPECMCTHGLVSLGVIYQFHCPSMGVRNSLLNTYLFNFSA